MTTVLSNPDITDDERRTRLYSGHVLVYPASPQSLALVEHARNLIAEAFGSKDPQTAQYDMPVDVFAALLAELKPKFIHHRESKERIRELLAAFGCDLDRTYFDVPRMRTSTANDYLTSGVTAEDPNFVGLVGLPISDLVNTAVTPMHSGSDTHPPKPTSTTP